MVPLFAGGAIAQELIFQPRVSLGYQSYSFDIAGDDSLDVETDYLLGGLGLSVQRGRFFVDLYGQTNLTEAEDDEENFAGAAGIDRSSKVDRYELNATLGYAVTPNISVFGGVKYASNEIKSDFDSDDALIDALLGDSFFDVDVEYLGPFFGASYALPIADVGALALSASGAYLSGDTTVDAEIAGQVIADDQDIDGTAIGFNFGAAWIGSLAPLSPSLAKLGYVVGLDYSEYDFEDGNTDEFSEETLRFKVDVKYNF